MTVRSALPYVRNIWVLEFATSTSSCFGYGERAGLRFIQNNNNNNNNNNNKVIALIQRKLNLDFKHSCLDFVCKMHGNPHTHTHTNTHIHTYIHTYIPMLTCEDHVCIPAFWGHPFPRQVGK